MALHFRAKDTQVIEEAGRITEATLVFIIDELTGTLIGDVFYNAFNYPDIPQPGESLSSVESLEHVRVERRTPQYIGRNSNGAIVEVTVDYKAQYGPVDYRYTMRGASTLNQIVTQKDRNGNPIELEHNGNTVRAEVTVPIIADQLSMDIVLQTKFPEDIKAGWLNHTNDSAWMGGDVDTWLCTRCDPEPINLVTDPPWYRFYFEFERNPDKHLYTVGYKNEDDYYPPDLVEGVGIKDIVWHTQRNFSEYFA